MVHVLLALILSLAMTTTDPCVVADFSGDGVVDGDDVCDFVAAYQAGDHRADVYTRGAELGTVNEKDLEYFLAQYAACLSE